MSTDVAAPLLGKNEGKMSSCPGLVTLLIHCVLLHAVYFLTILIPCSTGLSASITPYIHGNRS